MSKMQHRRCIHQSSAASQSDSNLLKHQSRSRKGTSFRGLAKLSLLLLTLFSLNSVAYAEEKKYNRAKASSFK